MGFAKEKYLKKWVGLDHNEGNNFVNSKQFQAEIMLYVTKLKNQWN